MTITFNGATICHGQSRGQPGEAIGPDGLLVSEAPGTVSHEFIGADRVQNEHVRCDRGTVRFRVTRTYGSVAAALAYVRGGYLAEPREGVLKFGDTDMFGGNTAVMTGHQLAMVGCTVVVNYAFEG